MADTKLTALTELTTPATTDIVYGVATPGGTPASKKIQIANLPLGFGTWTDYSSTSTVVGFSSTTTKEIFYMKWGKMVFVLFNLTGTVNSATMTFTVPVAMKATPPSYVLFTTISKDGASAYTVGTGQLNQNASTVTLLKDITFGAYAASGTREVYGQFWYVTA